MSFLQSAYAFIGSIEFTFLKGLIDLNDLRNLAAISGVVITVYAASKKWGNKVICHAVISRVRNRPTHISSLSIANLKDKPLIVYEMHIRFNKHKSYFCLQKFDPPLVVKGLEATSVESDAYSSLNTESDPFNKIDVDFDLFLVTERTVIKCKMSSSPEGLIRKHMKGLSVLGVSTKKFNNKVYNNDAAYALVYVHNGNKNTSFLMGNGHIFDEWPFPINALPTEAMQSFDTLNSAIEELSLQVSTKLMCIKLD